MKILLIVFAVLFILGVAAYFFLGDFLAVQKKETMQVKDDLLQEGVFVNFRIDKHSLKLSQSELEFAVRRNTEIIKQRMKEFGLKPVSLEIVNSDQIRLLLPGNNNIDRITELAAKTAVLQFKLVADYEDTQMVYDELNAYLKDNYGKYSFLQEINSTREIDNQAENLFTILITDNKGFPDRLPYQHKDAYERLISEPEFIKHIPAGFELALEKVNSQDPYAPRSVYVLHSKVELSGSYLKNVTVRIGQNTYDAMTSSKPYIDLEFDREGTKRFEKVTGDNIKRRLAIVLDDVVYVAPVINERIPSGKAQINGSFTLEEAKALEIVLRSGNLAVPMHVIEVGTFSNVNP